jgi:hypothetical protein
VIFVCGQASTKYIRVIRVPAVVLLRQRRNAFNPHISPLAWVLYIFVRLPLDDIYYFKSCFAQHARDIIYIEEIKININLLVEKIVEMYCVVADMKRKQ